MAGDPELQASLSRAGIELDPVAARASSVTAAAAPYRQPDGTYRFENRLRFWILGSGR